MVMLKKLMLFALCLCLLGLPVAVSAATNAAPYDPLPEDLQFSEELLNLVNQMRVEAGLTEMSNAYVELNTAAQVRALEQAVKFSHTRPNGQPAKSVLAEFEIPGTGGRWGDVLNRDSKTPERALATWMESKDHHKNILSPSYTYVGVAHVKVGDNPARHYSAMLFLSLKPTLALEPMDLMVGETREAALTVTPPHPYLNLKWTTSDPAVATVDVFGNITAVGPGSAKISVSAVTRSDDNVEGEEPPVAAEITVTDGLEIKQDSAPVG